MKKQADPDGFNEKNQRDTPLSRDTYKLRELEINDALRAQVATTVSSDQLSCIDVKFKLFPDSILAKGSQGCMHLCHSLEKEAEKLLPMLPFGTFLSVIRAPLASTSTNNRPRKVTRVGSWC